MVVIVPDEAEVRARRKERHERYMRLTEGKSVRFKRRMARIERTETGRDVPMVRVLPKDETIRENIVHPNGDLAFPEKTGSAEWPLDQFTLRRLRDGDITLDESHPHQQVRATQIRPRPVPGAARGPIRPTQPPRTTPQTEPKVP